MTTKVEVADAAQTACCTSSLLESEESSADRIAVSLNQECYCVSVDETKLYQLLADATRSEYDWTEWLEHRPHLFAPFPVYVPRHQILRMHEVVEALLDATKLPGYIDAVLEGRPTIARHEPASHGVFYGFDFHLTHEGPRLIEINTNAGGGLLQLFLARAQRACCEAIEPFVERLLEATPFPVGIDPSLESAVVGLFQRELEREQPGAELRRVAVVDASPEEQFLHPELLLFQAAFETKGVACDILDPSQLRYEQGALIGPDGPIDLVYNRLTDFYLEDEWLAPLAQAYLEGACVVTPHPYGYGVRADKRNLILLSDVDRMRDLGASEHQLELLAAAIPRTFRVTEENANQLWQRRKALFFKPSQGFGSGGVYRGEKLTKKVWRRIVGSGNYVVQDLVRPSQRTVLVDGATRPLKVDLRCFVHDEEVQHLGARLYTGQVTNMRSEGGGLASVFVAS